MVVPSGVWDLPAILLLKLVSRCACGTSIRSTAAESVAEVDTDEHDLWVADGADTGGHCGGLVGRAVELRVAHRGQRQRLGRGCNELPHPYPCWVWHSIARRGTARPGQSLNGTASTRPASQLAPNRRCHRRMRVPPQPKRRLMNWATDAADRPSKCPSFPVECCRRDVHRRWPCRDSLLELPIEFEVPELFDN